ncbi:expressed protein, partial [Aureococcus anophagefferens]
RGAPRSTASAARTISPRRRPAPRRLHGRAHARRVLRGPRRRRRLPGDAQGPAVAADVRSRGVLVFLPRSFRLPTPEEPRCPTLHTPGNPRASGDSGNARDSDPVAAFATPEPAGPTA